MKISKQQKGGGKITQIVSSDFLGLYALSLQHTITDAKLHHARHSKTATKATGKNCCSRFFGIYACKDHTQKKKKKVRRRGSGNWLRPTGKAVGSPAEIFRKPFVCALNPVTPAMTRATARRVERSAHARDALAAPEDSLQSRTLVLVL